MFSLVLLSWFFDSASYREASADISPTPKHYLQFTDKETETKQLGYCKSHIYELGCQAHSSDLNSKARQARLFSLRLSQSVHDFIKTTEILQDKQYSVSEDQNFNAASHTVTHIHFRNEIWASILKVVHIIMC